MEERSTLGSSGTGASKTACVAQGAVWGPGIVGGFGGRNVRALLPRRDGRRCPAALQRAGCPRRFSSPHFEDGGSFHEERRRTQPGSWVLSRQEQRKGEDPEGPLFTLRPGWESQVEPQGFIWQPRLSSPHRLVNSSQCPLQGGDRALEGTPWRSGSLHLLVLQRLGQCPCDLGAWLWFTAPQGSTQKVRLLTALPG